MRRCVCIVVLILTALALLLCSSICWAGGGPKNVVVVINDSSPISQAIGAYYQSKRGIPDSNVCHIQCPTVEEIPGSVCESDIVCPIRSFLSSHPFPDRIDYIVLTKGIPLKAAYDNAYFSGPVSIASLLTCVGEPSIFYSPFTTYDPTVCPPIINPYGPTASPDAPEQYFTHQLSFQGRSFYAVTRLDAYVESDIYRMIDDAVIAQPATGVFLLDGADARAYPHICNRLRQANTALINSGYQTYYSTTEYDARLREFVGGQHGVIGYFSWGSNEGYSFTQSAYTSNYFVPGSIADSYVSFSGRTFTYPPSPGQSLLADLIPQGLCGGNAYVSEPNINTASYPGVLFDRYTKGYNLAESFMAANPYLYWKSVIIGDPLMAPFATPPEVSIDASLAGSSVHDTVSVSVQASDASGVAGVEFYVDNVLVGTCASAPYQFEWDTKAWSDGTHVLEAIAYEDTPVYTQARAVVEVDVCNTPQPVDRVGQLDSIADGRLVTLTAKIVTAGVESFQDCIYICEPDRTAGIKVVGVADMIAGDIVDVTGEKRTINGEKIVTRAMVWCRGAAAVPGPLGMTNSALSARGSYTGPGASSLPIGLSSTGLLVKTWGQVLQTETGCFYVSDRSIRTPTGPGRLKVSTAGMNTVPQAPAVGSYVELTGISALEPSGEYLQPVLRLRTPTDIRYCLQMDHIRAPQDAIAAEWYLLSIPGVPVNPAAASLFPDVALDQNLLCWDSSVQGMCIYNDFQPETFPPLCIGVGFWLRTSVSPDLTVRVLKTAPSVDMWISLPLAGSAMIGHPFPVQGYVSGFRVSDGVQMLTVQEAVDSGWLDGQVWGWNSELSAVELVDFGWDQDAVFQPWRGYWVASLRPNLALIIPYQPG